jgi:hypothetical protein
MLSSPNKSEDKLTSAPFDNMHGASDRPLAAARRDNA